MEQLTEVKELDFIESEYLNELPYFETFLNRVGFKRIDGAVYGLLVLASRPLTSEEIENALGLSQSAISISLKNLTHFGAIETADSPENKRIKVHWAKDDSLNIVATIFRKREGQYIEEFKLMVQRLLRRAQADGPEKRIVRLRSIIATCEAAEAIMGFVISLTRLQIFEHYNTVLTKLPRNLDALIKSAEGLNDFQHMREGLSSRIEKIRQSFVK